MHILNVQQAMGKLDYQEGLEKELSTKRYII